MESPRDWLQLPDDVLELILSKLGSVRDVAHSFLVCKPWRSVGLKRIEQKQIAYLLVPNEDSVDPNAEQRRGLYSVQENKVVHSIRIPHGKRFCGSSYGWLITHDIITGLTLFNPFSGSSIGFPPVTRTRYRDGLMCAPEEGMVPYPYRYNRQRVFLFEDGDFGIDDDVENLSNYNFDYRIIKSSLSRDPEIYPNDFVLVVMYGFWGRLAFIRPGDEDWTYLPNDKEHFEDVICYKNKFHFVTAKGQLFSCDDKEFPPTLERIIPAFDDVGSCGKPYLVELPHGELYLLYRVRNSNGMRRFDIFKFEINDGEAKWALSLDLGNATIFLGDNCSLSTFASDFCGCKPNAVYYTDDYDETNGLEVIPYHWREEEALEGPTENGFYDVSKNEIGEHYQLKPTEKILPPPIWISLKFK